MLVTTNEAAKRLKLKNTSTIRRLIAAGRIKATKQGRDWLIEETEVERYARERRGPGRPKEGK